MTLTRFVLPSLVLGMVLSVLPSVATAGIVYGNLGANGTSPSTTGGGNIGLAVGDYAAVGFNTGAATFGTLKVNSVNLMLTGGGGVSANQVEIWSSTGSGAGATPNSILNLSAFAINKSNPAGNVWTFSFNANPEDGVQLTQNTDYWLVLKGPSSWRVASDLLLPTQQNNPPSQYGMIAGVTNSTYASLFSSDGTTWGDSGTPRAAFAINAVPEPSTYAMAGIGAGLLGLAKFRRRLGRSETQG